MLSRHHFYSLSYWMVQYILGRPTVLASSSLCFYSQGKLQLCSATSFHIGVKMEDSCIYRTACGQFILRCMDRYNL